MPTASRCRAHSILQAVVLAMISVVTTNVAAQDGAADGNPSAASHITRPAADMTRPVAVIDRRDIELSGMTNLGDLLLRRSVYNSFGIYRPFVLGSGRSRFSSTGAAYPIQPSISTPSPYRPSNGSRY